MTTVSDQEFSRNPAQYLAVAASGDVVVTQNGEPWIVLRAVEDDQDRLSAVYANSPEFRQMIDERRQERPIAWDEAKNQLGL
ncbi:MAG: type II toxin-antitoxin system prevent-host-death family antitoxin [Pirellulales bacterium]